LAETINGLYKAEVIHRQGPWRSFEAVEFATLEWVDWFNNRRLLHQPSGIYRNPRRRRLGHPHLPRQPLALDMGRGRHAVDRTCLCAATLGRRALQATPRPVNLRYEIISSAGHPLAK